MTIQAQVSAFGALLYSRNGSISFALQGNVGVRLQFVPCRGRTFQFQL